MYFFKGDMEEENQPSEAVEKSEESQPEEPVENADESEAEEEKPESE